MTRKLGHWSVWRLVGGPPGKPKRRGSHRRVLRAESLESRMLLAGDLGCSHNALHPEDVNADGVVSPMDALHVINELDPESESSADDALTDVNGDGTTTPMDALLVINQLDDDSDESSVPLENRIARLREAIESGNLPRHLDADRAAEVLATLEAGGQPELGDRFHGGMMFRGSRGGGLGFGGPFGGGQPSEGAIQQRITRLRDAIENSTLPEHVDAGRAAAMLEALENGEIPSGQRGRHGGRSELTEEAMLGRIERLREAIESGDLPEHVDADRAAKLLEALENGETPRLGRPGMGHGQRQEPSAEQLQARADRLRDAIETGNLPAHVSAERADELLAALENGELPGFSVRPAVDAEALAASRSRLRGSFGRGAQDRFFAAFGRS